jgi:hypothetical protein
MLNIYTGGLSGLAAGRSNPRRIGLRRQAAMTALLTGGSGLLFTAAVVVGALWASATPVAAHNWAHSHLRIDSTTLHGDHSDPVINNSIVVTIKAKRDRAFPCQDEIDQGVLTLTPGSTPSFSWNCNSCPNGFFQTVTACASQGACQSGDVFRWIVGVHLQMGGGNQPCDASPHPGMPNLVQYLIDSDDLGNGNRAHVASPPPDCSVTVTAVDAAYQATDLDAGWDNATLCSDSGVSITLDYE